MSFIQNIALGLGSVVCAFALVACGGNKGTPQCGDKEVLEALNKSFDNSTRNTLTHYNLSHMMARGEADKEAANAMIAKLQKGADIKLNDIVTQSVDEVAKKVTCKATKTIHSTLTRDDVKEFMYLSAESELQEYLKLGERLSEKNLKEVMMRQANAKHDNQSTQEAMKDEMEREVEKQVQKFKAELEEKIDDFLKFSENHEDDIEFSAQRTSEGKVKVEILD